MGRGLYLNSGLLHREVRREIRSASALIALRSCGWLAIGKVGDPSKQDRRDKVDTDSKTPGGLVPAHRGL
jgi:hypothetical protein